MQAIIMAAGKGSRLGQLTAERPKAFLEIRSYKLIEYHIALLHTLGVDKITIVTGYKSECFEELTRNIEGVQCVYNPFYEMMNVLGSFYMGQEYLADDDTIYLHADTLCNPEIAKDMLSVQGDVIMPIEYKRCDEEAMKIVAKDGKITQISKLIDQDDAEGEFIGVCLIRKSALPAIKENTKQLLKNKQFQSYFEGAIQGLANQGQYEIVPVSTGGRFWCEIDFLEDYEQAKVNLSESLYEIVKNEFNR